MNKLDVVFIWHMHQPYYKDPIRGEYTLPWVYLHAIKDYYDMPKIVENVSGAKVVFNLVPSLIEQLLDYANDTANDKFLRLAKLNPSSLNFDERLFIIENFWFSCHTIFDTLSK